MARERGYLDFPREMTLNVNELRNTPADEVVDRHDRQPGRADLGADPHGQRRPPARADRAGRHGRPLGVADPRQRVAGLPHRRQPVPARRARALQPHRQRPRPRPRRPGRAEDHPGAGQAEVLRADPRRVPPPGAARPPRRVDGRRGRERDRHDRRRRAGARRRDAPSLRASRSRPTTSTSTASASATSTTSSCATASTSRRTAWSSSSSPIDKQTGKLIGKPDVVSRGVTGIEESEELLEGAREAVISSLEGADHIAEWTAVNQTVKDAVAKLPLRRDAPPADGPAGRRRGIGPMHQHTT